MDDSVTFARAWEGPLDPGTGSAVMEIRKAFGILAPEGILEKSPDDYDRG